MNSEFFSKILTAQEIDSVKSMKVKGRSHPLTSILFSNDKKTKQTAVNTEIALKHILRVNSNWFTGIKHRLLKSDLSDAASALSEIRAYGYLLETGLSVEPMSPDESKTYDFLIKKVDGEKVRVEVFAKQYDSEVAKDLEKFHSESAPLKEGVTCRISDPIAPFGKPKKEKGENVAANVISRLACIKQDEKQLSDKDTSVLWLDFQDDIWWLLEVDSVLPIRTWSSGFYSGEIWYAFYGFKNAPIFEANCLDLIKIGHFVRMRHEGRFRQITKVDAVIITFPNHSVILENPESKKPIKSWLTEGLIKMPWFCYEYSYINYPHSKLREYIELQKQLILSFARLDDDNS